MNNTSKGQLYSPNCTRGAAACSLMIEKDQGCISLVFRITSCIKEKSMFAIYVPSGGTLLEA